MLEKTRNWVVSEAAKTQVTIKGRPLQAWAAKFVQS